MMNRAIRSLALGRLCRLGRTVPGRRSNAGAFLWIVSAALAAAANSLAAPLIVSQPLSQSVVAGTDVQLSIQAVSATNLVLDYQWTKNGLALTGATNSTLIIAAPQVTDTGTYRVSARDATGATQSQAARLWVRSDIHTATPLPLTGWNADVVSENASSTLSTTFDGAGASWFEANLQGHADGLPQSRQFTSEITTNVLYQLQPYNQPNVLLLRGSDTNALNLVNPALIERLYLAVSGGSGTSSLTLHLEFEDGSQSPPLRVVVPDWFNGGGFNDNLDTHPFRAVQGLARNNSNGAAFSYEAGGANDLGFGLYENSYDLRALGLNQKRITGLIFTKPRGSLTAGVFAVSAFQAAPQLQNPRLGADGLFTFDLIAPVGSKFAIESSDDLAAWRLEFSTTANAESTEVSLPLATGATKRCFRAVLR